jgi:hypothetical protein
MNRDVDKGVHFPWGCDVEKRVNFLRLCRLRGMKHCWLSIIM